MNLTANQLYKQSKSNLTFKEWLKTNQQKGILDDHEKMYNMIDGEQEIAEEEEEAVVTTKPKTTTQKSVTKLSAINLVGLIGIGILIYGLTKTSAE